MSSIKYIIYEFCIIIFALLEAALQPGETALRWMDGTPPLGLMMGRQDGELLDLAGRLVLRYTRAEAGENCRLRVTVNESDSIRMVPHVIGEAEVERYRIA